MAKILHVAVLNRKHELVDERIAREIQDPGIAGALEKLLADSLKQVTFAQAHSAMDEQRVIRLPGLFRDSQ
jgi:hypothetical protein